MKKYAQTARRGFGLSGAMSGLSGLSGVCAVQRAVLLSDHFTGADTTNLTAHTMDVGSGWTATAGTWTIETNKAKVSNTSNAIVTADAGALNVSVQVTMTTHGAGTDGIVARFIDTSNYVQFKFNNSTGQADLRVIVAASSNLRGTASGFTFADGDIIKMIWGGNSVSCVFNGAVLYTYTLSAPEIAALGTATKCGMYASSDTTVRFDDFLVTTQDSVTVLAVNSGGNATGIWIADAMYTGGDGTTVVPDAITTSGVANPAPQAVYQTERYGDMIYTLTGLAAGQSYLVRLHLAEIYFSAAAARKFNVKINSVQVLTDYDIYAQTGGQFVAIAPSFSAVANGSGQIVVEFITGAVDKPKISGIEIKTL